MALRQVGEAEFEAEVLRHPTRVIVDFYADWCPPCRALAPLLERFAAEHAERVRVVKVDADSDEVLAERYHVRTIPTLVAFEGGEEVARAVNPQSRAKLAELLGPG